MGFAKLQGSENSFQFLSKHIFFTVKPVNKIYTILIEFF